VPLTISTVEIARETASEREVGSAAREWADTVGWQFAEVDNDRGLIVVRLEGPLPLPDPAAFRTYLDSRGTGRNREESRGIAIGDVRLDLAPKQSTVLDEPSG